LHKKDKKISRLLMIIVSFSFLTFPIYFIIRYFDVFTIYSANKLWIHYVLDFNYFLAFYSLTINSLYMVLLFFSFKMVARQSRMWRAKNINMLFKRKMLPSVSIVSPAYCEESTIVESINSLLNLKYPDYDLIVVNDGSSDKTLQTVIDYYQLKRHDVEYKEEIQTMRVNGIYKNKSIPKLILVDKENGGKADSLNAGMNVASKTYVCGIDADSLLEDHALLKLAAMTLDEDIFIPALGGNIFPINGCEVSKGLMTKTQIPRNHVARFQTVEYIRAFMAGRLGWAYFNSLLIISGAFGLFEKKRL
jgi:cellulose synthase/poly-beta-1,6-N-acetylglucosamine synthase-like glycosyltransferase